MTDKPGHENYLGYYAGFVSRLMAFVLDLIATMFSVVTVTWLITVTNTVFRLSETYEYLRQRFPGFIETFERFLTPAIGSLLVLLFVISYHAIFLTLLGQTPGKLLVGIRVLTVKGKPLSFWRSVFRVLCYPISAIPLYLGFLLVLVDDHRQALHDKLAGTYVVYAWKARPDERFLVEFIDKLQGRFQRRLPPPNQP